MKRERFGSPAFDASSSRSVRSRSLATFIGDSLAGHKHTFVALRPLAQSRAATLADERARPKSLLPRKFGDLRDLLPPMGLHVKAGRGSQRFTGRAWLVH